MNWRYRTPCLVALFAVSTLAGAACSSSDDKGGGAPDGGPPGNPPDGGGSVDGGGDAGGGDGGDGGEPTRVTRGTVTVSDTVANYMGHATSNYEVTAGFTDSTGLGKRSCEISTQGACYIQNCATNGAADAGVPKVAHAGNIQVTGPGFTPAIQLNPTAAGTYKNVTGSISLWIGGDTIKVRAAGNPNGVSAFEANVKAPSHLKLMNPTWPEREPGPIIERSRNLALEWSYSEAASGIAQALFSTSASGRDHLIICQYPLTDKKGTVPASVMSHLPPGRGDFAVYSIEESYPDVTGWDVNVLLMSFGARQGGGYATGYAYW